MRAASRCRPGGQIVGRREEGSEGAAHGLGAKRAAMGGGGNSEAMASHLREELVGRCVVVEKLSTQECHTAKRDRHNGWTDIST